MQENTELQYKQILTEKEYQEACAKYGYSAFRVGMGAESIKELLEAIDLEKESAELKSRIKRCYRPETCHESSNVWKL